MVDHFVELDFQVPFLFDLLVDGLALLCKRVQLYIVALAVEVGHQVFCLILHPFALVDHLFERVSVVLDLRLQLFVLFLLGLVCLKFSDLPPWESF